MFFQTFFIFLNDQSDNISTQHTYRQTFNTEGEKSIFCLRKKRDMTKICPKNEKIIPQEQTADFGHTGYSADFPSADWMSVMLSPLSMMRPTCFFVPFLMCTSQASSRTWARFKNIKLQTTVINWKMDSWGVRNSDCFFKPAILRANHLNFRFFFFIFWRNILNIQVNHTVQSSEFEWVNGLQNIVQQVY